MNQVVELLSKIPPFDLFTHTSLANLIRHVKVDKIWPGSYIMEAGNTVDQLFIVLRGKIGIIRQSPREPGYEAGGPGTVIGLLEFLGGNDTSTTARAEEETIILTITRQDFFSFLKNHPEEAIALIILLAEHLHEAGVRMDVTVSPAYPALPSINKMEDDASPLGVSIEEFGGIKYEHKKEEEENPYYTKRFTCAFCGTQFYSLVIKSKYIQLEKTDSDFCPHYRTYNPMFYETAVCPQCGYAFTPEMPAKLNDRARAKLAALLSVLKTPLRFDGERDLYLAIESYRLAFACLEAIGGKKSQLGKLYLKIAWLYRTAGQESEEREYCEKALFCFLESYRTEQSTDPKLELNLLYLLGDLNYRLGRTDLAMRWLGTILAHPKRQTNPKILERARELIYEIRQSKSQDGPRPVGE